MSASGTGLVFSSACGLSSPGTWTVIMLPGLKPSLRFHSAGLIATPSVLTGIASAGRFTRRPVGVFAFLVYRLLGNGCRQGRSSRNG
jgi:hypothetical protein